MSSTRSQSSGFDAPVMQAEDDHLNRWPLARQIYNVASNGPDDWSARIGVYGEWGTGKTSVLKFVASMAEQDGHIVVWFDPWGYASKPDLWQAFVMKCCDEIEGKLGGITVAGNVRRKSYLKTARDLFGKAASIVPGSPGSVATGAIGLLKGTFSFGPKDMEKLRADLAGKRVFVLVDDLDRTAAELVPEILYALKEVLDIPGFSFVCGFDPAVVGEVLHASHRGFGDGQKFLEKIIDYPVWLPSPSPEGLMKIALADAARHCDFIPTGELRQAVALLPKNPRTIRQFIRLLSLLKNQVQRYNQSELRWPIILAACVIKIRYPKLAPNLLNDREFWRATSASGMFTSRSDKKASAEINQHIEKCSSNQSLVLSTEDKAQIHNAFSLILRSLDNWTWNNVNTVCHQLSITDAPEAVTWKEFDQCVAHFTCGIPLEKLSDWISTHSKIQRCPEAEVASELVTGTTERYCQELDKADTAFTDKQVKLHKKHAEFLFRLLDVLINQLGKASSQLQDPNWIPLGEFMSSLMKLADDNRTIHREMWPRAQKLLFGLVENWSGELKLLQAAVRSIHPNRNVAIENKAARQCALELNTILDNRLGATAANGFSEPGFVERICYDQEEVCESHRLMFDINSSLWVNNRSSALAILRRATSSPTVRDNAYAFLNWVNSLLRSRTHSNAETGKEIVGEGQIIIAIWNAATAVPFTPRYAYRLHDLPEAAQKLGVHLKKPRWWDTAVAQVLAEYKKREDQNKEEDEV